MTDPDGVPFDPTTRKWYFVAILCGSLPYSLFAVLGDRGRARAAGICCFVGMIAARAFWHRRRHPWFWIALAVLVALHVALVLSISWSDKSYPGYTLLPEAALDYGVFYGSFRLAEKVLGRSGRNNSPN